MDNPPLVPQPIDNLRISSRSYSVTTSMECVRGLAALWVFLFHISDLVRISFPQLYGIAKEGYRGVPIFFAVSGYCIFAAAQRCVRKKSESKSFLQRRLIRIFPTFWASLVVVVILPYVIEGLASLKAGRMAWPSPAWMHYTMLDWLGVISLTKELLDGVRGGGAGYTLINSVYWTLAIEVQFYLVLYLAISFRRHWLTIVAAVSVASFLCLATSLFMWKGFFLQFWPAFLCGVLLRVAYSSGLDPKSLFGKHELMGAAIFLGVMCGFIAWIIKSQSGISFIATAAVSALVLWTLGGIENGLANKESMPAALRRQGRALLTPFVLLGHSSYSLYLLHGKLDQLPAMFVRQIFPESNPLHLLSVVSATVLLCYGFYYLVERRYQGHPAPAKSKAVLVGIHGDDGSVGKVIADEAG